MELTIAVGSNEYSAARPSCHPELLFEEVGSLYAVAMDGGVDLLLVGLPSLPQLFVGLTVFPASAECRQDCRRQEATVSACLEALIEIIWKPCSFA